MEGVESGPAAVPQDSSSARNVATNGPLLLAAALGGIIKEVSNKNIIAALGLFLLFELLALAQVHEALELG